MKYSKQALIKNSTIVFHIIFAIFGLFTYLINYNLSENLIIQKTLSKQLIIAKSGSIAVENLFTSAQNELSSFIFSFTKVNAFSSVDTTSTRIEFNSYMTRALLPITGISYYDATGKLIIIENRQHLRTGENQDYSNLDFIIWSRNPANKDKVFISTPYIAQEGASIGKTILTVAKPIYFDNSYKGTLGIRILVDNFKKAFVDPLVSDENEDSFIVDTNGVFVAGRNTLRNKNLFDYASQQKWSHADQFITTLHQAITEQSTQTTWVFKNPQEEPKELLVGMSKIDVPNTDKDLYMVVTVSKQSILTALKSLRLYGYVWLVISVVITTIEGIMLIVFKKHI